MIIGIRAPKPKMFRPMVNDVLPINAAGDKPVPAYFGAVGLEMLMIENIVESGRPVSLRAIVSPDLRPHPLYFIG
jgi:hypothetical protein